MFSNNDYDKIDKIIMKETTDPAAAPPEVDNQEASLKKRTGGRCRYTSKAGQDRSVLAELRATLILMMGTAHRKAWHGRSIHLAFAIISLSAAVANAQAPVVSNVTVDPPSYSTARIQWTSSSATSYARVQYDSLTSTLPFANSTQQSQSGNVFTTQGFTLGGLAPNTTYYFVACSANQSNPSQEGCSSVNSFKTAAAPAGWPTVIPTPTLPTVPPLPAMPTIGTSYTVSGASDCSDATNGLQAQINAAAALGGATNKAVLIPPSYTCIGNYALPVNTGTGWIVVRTAAPDSSLPPEGVRIDSTYASVMPTISALNAYANPLGAAFYNVATTSNWRIGPGLRITLQPGQHPWIWFPYSYPNSNMIVERNIFYDVGTTCSGSTCDSVKPAGIVANGVNTWISNNQITAVDPGDAATAIEFTSAQTISVDNNYIDGLGIAVFGQENALQTVNSPQGSNYQVSRNYFAWNPSFQSSGSGIRQHLEWKAGNLILVNGNIFTSQWDNNGTGSYSQSVELTPRNGNQSLSFNNYLADITITNNSWYNVPGGIQLWGGENTAVPIATPATRRVKIANNLMHDINGYYTYPSTVQGNGHFLAFGEGGLEAVTVDHNTFLGNRGVLPCQLCWNGNPGASIRITNNVLTATYDSYYGLGNLLWQQDTSGQLPAPPASQTTASSVLSGISTNNPGSDPSALFTGNAIVPMINSGYSSNTPANYALAAAAYTPVNCSLYWSSLPGNTCIGDATTTTANSALSKVGLWGPLGNLSGYPTVGNWRLRYNSPYISGGKPAGTNPTTDGLDAGADIDQIEAAQGVISNVHLFFTALGPTISFLAPDSFSCSIDVDPSSDNGNFTPGVFSRVPGSAVSGTGRRAQQNVMLSGLTAHAQYTLRVNCSSQQPTINLQMP